ncbi:hypothetical protein BSL78_00981 [Apostichopus japonicus]|uniref:Solute-binding protein family 3/N-terminal domain-containing protein n=1 Tax=Stichopus japonicus TaxID=307972 RepID=A0A2G8LPA9_STIJA|nr:hypothetical protein BSL78_00981 [Apostichopus japonicus]
MASSEPSRYGLFLVFAICAIVSLLALLLSSVAIGRSSASKFTVNPGTLKQEDDDYVWTFAAGHSWHGFEYRDESTGELRGFTVDLINAVCQEANKKCEIIRDLYINCWDAKAGGPAHGGTGLMGGWYDGCSAWSQTRQRLNTFKFSKPYVQQLAEKITFYTADADSDLDWRDLTNRTVAFLDGWPASEDCILLYDEINGFDKSNARHYPSIEEFIVGIQQKEVDCGFAALSEKLQKELHHLTTDELDFKCTLSAPSIMMRKDSQLDTWWNEAFDRIRANGKYSEVCRDLYEVHV